MDQSLFIAFVNPTVALILAAGFLLLPVAKHRRRDVRLFGIAYALSAAGFILQRYDLESFFPVSRLFSCACFLAATALMVVAICRRYAQPVPVAGLGVAVVCGFLAFTWFLFVEPSLTWRILSANFALGALSLLAAATLRRVPDKLPIDIILFAVSLMVAGNFVVRTLLILSFEGGVAGYDKLYISPYWVSTMLSHVVLSLTAALCLFISVATDGLRDARAQSWTDPLSGLLNRRGLDERASRFFGIGASHTNAALCVVMADIDHFKAINDRHGHAAGDAVIAAFSRLLVKMAGSDALVARTGGEEFCIVLANSNLAAARLFAEGVRSVLASGTVMALPGVDAVTCSFGVAERLMLDNLDSATARADDALMQAKRDGRNRVAVWRPLSREETTRQAADIST